MGKMFRKFAATIAICFTMVSCGWLTKLSNGGNENNNPALGSSMIVSYTMDASMKQVDSICRVDKLPALEGWLTTQFTDYETGQPIVRRMYIKEYGETEIIYIITGTDEPFVVTRRITE